MFEQCFDLIFFLLVIVFIFFWVWEGEEERDCFHFLGGGGFFSIFVFDILFFVLGEGERVFF